MTVDEETVEVIIGLRAVSITYSQLRDAIATVLKQWGSHESLTADEIALYAWRLLIEMK